jgi:hypothetical protein
MPPKKATKRANSKGRKKKGPSTVAAKAIIVLRDELIAAGNDSEAVGAACKGMYKCDKLADKKCLDDIMEKLKAFKKGGALGGKVGGRTRSRSRSSSRKSSAKKPRSSSSAKKPRSSSRKSSAKKPRSRSKSKKPRSSSRKSKAKKPRSSSRKSKAKKPRSSSRAR